MKLKKTNNKLKMKLKWTLIMTYFSVIIFIEHLGSDIGRDITCESISKAYFRSKENID